MTKTETNDITMSKPLLEMITVANEYCLFFEKAASYQANDILTYFHRIAPLLYLKASLLEAAPANKDAWNERYVTEEEWESVFKTLREKFGKKDRYYIHDHNFDSIEASLADNLADIFQDMKDFVLLYQKNNIVARRNAIANMLNLFGMRWGQALINALGAVHQILHKEKIDPDIYESDKDWLF